MNKMSVTFGIIMSILIFFISCKKESPIIPVSGITINTSSLELNVGDTITLKVTVEPVSATNKKIEWSSSNNSIVTVSLSGKIQGIAPGIDTIKATTTDGNLNSICIVTVTKWTTYLHNIGIRSMAMDSLQNIWIGTCNGILYKYNGTDFTPLSLWPNSVIPIPIQSIAIDTNNYKWIGVGLAGLSKYYDTTLTQYNSSNSGMAEDAVEDINIDSQGNLWLGMNNSGVIEFDGAHWTNFNSSNSGLTFNTINALAIEKSGKKWFCTNSSGVCVFDNISWTNYTTSNSDLLNNWVTAVLIDNQNNKWFGSSGGISKFDGTNWTNNDQFTFVDAIAMDKNGVLWFGTEGSGVAKFDGINWKNFTAANSKLVDNIVYTILIDKLGNKWFGTNKGLVELQEH